MVHWKMYAAALAALINAVSLGFISTYSSTATENMKSHPRGFYPSNKDVSWIGSIVPLGALFGGIFAGYLSDQLGRKGVLMLTSAPLVAGWLCIAFANALAPILIGRFLTGVCVGLICVVTPIYVVEISVSEVRGSFGGSFQLFISIGVFLVSMLGIFINWYWLAHCGAVIATLAVIIMCFVPESPKWLIAQRKHSEAVEAIKFLHGNNVNADQECISLNDALTAESSLRFSCADMCKPSIYKPAFLSLGLVFFQQFCGSNAILFYTVKIFGAAEQALKPSEANLCVAAAMVFFTWISCHFVDSFGRKKFLLISGLIMAISLAALGSFEYISLSMSSAKDEYGWISILCVVVYIASFSLGFGPITWLMIPEISPMKARSFICGMGTTMCWFFAFIITKSFPDLQEVFPDYGIFWIYSGFSFISCFFTVFLLPETKGISLEEIERFFSGEQPMEILPETSDFIDE